MNQVIQKLADAKLVVTSKEMGKGREEDRLAIVDVAHEALIRHWPLLRKWLDENRDDLRFQRRLDVAAQYWYTNKRPGGLLWRSPDLDLLKDFNDRSSSDMTEVQTEFFHASIHRERFIKRMIWLTCSLLIILAIVSGFAAIYALKSRSIAVKETNKSRSMLAKNYWFNAITAKKDNDWLKASHFFARAGKEEGDLLQIKNCILNIHSYNNNLFLKSPLLKHDSYVNGAMLSKDESLIMTWSRDGTARLWRTKDGALAAQPMKHDGPVSGAKFTNDESLILSWSKAGTARLWDISADYGFPKENLPLLVEVITGTVMDDYGNVTVLGPEEWLKRKQEYIKICKDHLKVCKYKKANLYLKQKQAWKGE